MKNDAAFVEDWNKSHIYVWAVGQWLRGRGYDVSIKPSVLRPDAASRHKFFDDGDLAITQRIEVKHRPSLTFTCAQDYPYPTVFLDETYKIDRHPPQSLFAYIILNAEGSACCVILSGTRSHWVKETIFDKVQNRECENYACPVDRCKFFPLTQKGDAHDKKGTTA